MPTRYASGLTTATATAALLLFAADANAQDTSAGDWTEVALCIESDEVACPDLPADQIRQAAEALAAETDYSADALEALILARQDGLSVAEAREVAGVELPEPTPEAPVEQAETTEEATELADEAVEVETEDGSATDLADEAVDVGDADTQMTAEAETEAEAPETDTDLAEGTVPEAEFVDAPDEQETAEAGDEMPEADAEMAETADAAPAPEAEAETETVADALAEDMAETEGEGTETAETEMTDGADTEAVAEAVPEEAMAETDAETTAEADAAADAEAPAEAVADAETPPAPVEDVAGMTEEETAERAAELEALEAELAEGGEEIATEAEAPSAEEAAEIAERRAAEEAAALESEAFVAIDEEGSEAEATAGVEVETETVTDETAPTSAEDSTEMAATADDGGDDNTLRNILGAAAAAFIAGEILQNGDRVVERTDDRVVVNRNGEYVVLKDENTLLRQPGAQVRTENFADGSTRTVVEREDGVRVVTVRSPLGRILYRARVLPSGERYVLIDERSAIEDIDVAELPEVDPREQSLSYSERMDEDALAEALSIERERRALDRGYSLRQVREVRELREQMPRIDLDAITFATGSAAIAPNQAQELSALGRAMSRIIDENPGEIFLIEGHTDTVGSEVMNLALSDRRAESVALALTEYFDVPPENLVTQGYGERFLKYRIAGDVRENRRAAVRRITPLLQSADLR